MITQDYSSDWLHILHIDWCGCEDSWLLFVVFCLYISSVMWCSYPKRCYSWIRHANPQPLPLKLYFIILFYIFITSVSEGHRNNFQDICSHVSVDWGQPGDTFVVVGDRAIYVNILSQCIYKYQDNCPHASVDWGQPGDTFVVVGDRAIYVNIFCQCIYKYQDNCQHASVDWGRPGIHLWL